MNAFPTIELLERNHTFPGPYMFKVIGKSERGFLARAVGAVRQELIEDQDPPYRLREAVGGRHISVTLQPTVQTPEQVIAIYRRLRALSGLVMLL